MADGPPFDLAYGIGRFGARGGLLGGLSEDGLGRMLATLPAAKDGHEPPAT